MVHRNHFFCLYQLNKSSESKVNFRQAIIVTEGFLKLPNLQMLIKQTSPSFPRNVALQTFGKLQIANSVLNKGKSAIPPLFNDPVVLSSASVKAKLFAENFSEISNLDDSGISLPVFPSITNLKLHNTSVTPKMIITNLDLSKASGPDCTPVVVLQ